jgi:hypothetical protein
VIAPVASRGTRGGKGRREAPRGPARRGAVSRPAR